MLDSLGKGAVTEAGKQAKETAEVVHENVGETLGDLEALARRLLPLPLEDYEFVFQVRKRPKP